MCSLSNFRFIGSYSMAIILTTAETLSTVEKKTTAVYTWGKVKLEPYHIAMLWGSQIKNREI